MKYPAPVNSPMFLPGTDVMTPVWREWFQRLSDSQQAAEGDVTTADATEITTAIALANALKTKLNAVLAKLRSAEVIAT